MIFVFVSLILYTRNKKGGIVLKTLNDILTLPRFSDLQLLSTHKNLEKPLESVEITETPDVANFVSRRVMILTTAMYYKNDQSKLKDLIDSLKKIECAALVIKVGRFIEEIDQEIIDYATKIDLPLIKLPSTQTLGTLLHEILSYLWNSKTQQMSFAFDIQKRFSYLLMHDVSNARFIAEFGKIINAPIILLNPLRKVIAHSKHFSSAQKPASFYIEQLSSDNFQKVNQGEQSFVVTDTDGKSLQISGIPINVNNYFPYYLLILSPEKIPYPISEFAIEQAILVLTFILYKNQKIEESFENLKMDFLDQLLNSYNRNSFESHNWLDLGKNYGLIQSKSYQFALVSSITSQSNKTRNLYKQEESQIISSWLKEYLPTRIPQTAIFKLKKRNENVLIFQEPISNLADILTTISNQLSLILPITINFSIGNPYPSIDEIANSYIEASQTLETANLNNGSLVHNYHPKGLAGLFEKISGNDTQYFCQKNLKELAYPIEPMYKELRKTLKTFLDFNCEITKTANMLYLHRNTIKYRIKQCEELLDVPVYDPETSLILRVALELSET